MKTIWGENLDKDNVLPEYPRPQMVRESYLNLNGEWKYAVTDTDAKPDTCDGSILVPFSPECELSGVERILRPEETLWYERELTLPQGFVKPKSRILLHFGAVDQQCSVYMNGHKVCSHSGGYTSFYADITDRLLDDNILSVKVKDATDTSFHSRGKQTLSPGGIWYTPQSGIWQSVWLECVPENYIKALKITPDFDRRCVSVVVISDSNLTCKVTCEGRSAAGMTGEPIVIKPAQFRPWSPENPELYNISVEMDRDCVSSYFAMRKFTVEKCRDGVKRFMLNGKPYFCSGLLDQGYWPDGLYTAPSDEALIFDIQTAKKCGFNTLRKHIKIEPMRWYYHCDRLGIIVWQDMINGGGKYNAFRIAQPLFTGINHDDHDYKYFARESEEGRSEYYQELCEMIEQLYSVPSIALWTAFNEGWGQFDAKKALLLIESMDSSRVVDHASGWSDMKIGDTASKHVYFKKYRHRPDKQGRAVLLSEFGGYKCVLPEHKADFHEFGYTGAKTAETMAADIKKLYENEIIPAAANGLTAAIYTQLSDVEGELNGILSYDRRAEKIGSEIWQSVNNALFAAVRKD